MTTALRPSLALPAFSVIIPCYNEQAGIERTITDLRTQLAALEPYELIVVDDGSTDRTPLLLHQMAAEDPHLKIVRHERNRGYGAALKSGIRRAGADLIAITDADGTYPNDRLPDLLAAAREADMVVGARVGQEVTYSLIRRIPKAFLRRYCSWLVGRHIPDMNSGMRVFHKAAAEQFMKVLPDTFSFTTTITLAMMNNAYTVRFVPIAYHKRTGKSKIRPIRDTLRFFQLIVRTGMYFAPLRVLSPVIFVLGVLFLGSMTYDLFFAPRHPNLTDKTVMLLLFTMNTAIFALLADMIDKRSP